MIGLEVKNLSHAFGSHKVIDDVSLTVGPGKIICLLGPSGCGKTTLLRLAAGLERVQSGTIKVDGVKVADRKLHIPPEQRHVGLMFQDYALFPHLTVGENVAFGLEGRNVGDRKSRIDEVLGQVNMLDYRDAYPHVLSGGQQQRVALARALAPKPGVMLLDEPFSGLDEALRIQIREETLSVLREAGTAVLMVTHNPEEALFMSDRMLVMGPGGRILQAGAPDDVYACPKDPFVATFFGRTNRLMGVVSDGVVATPLGKFPAPHYGEGCKVQVIFRTHSVHLEINGSNGIPVDVVSARPMGRDTRVQFKVPGRGDLPVFLSRVRGRFPETPSGKVTARIVPEEAFVFHRDGDAS